MSEATKKLDFTQKIGGASIDLLPTTQKLEQLETIAPGTHRLLTFTLNTSENAWVLTNGGDTVGNTTYYAPGRVLCQQLTPIGRWHRRVPEPTSLGLLRIWQALGLLAAAAGLCGI